MVAPLIPMVIRPRVAALFPLPRLYGTSIEPFGESLSWPLYLLFPISMVAPLNSKACAWGALSALSHLYGDFLSFLWAACGALYSSFPISMVPSLIPLKGLFSMATLSPPPCLYGSFIDPYEGSLLDGNCVSSISMIPPLILMEDHSPMAALSPLPHLCGSSIDPYGEPISHGHSMPPSPSL